MRRLRSILSILLVSGVVATACGGGGDDSSVANSTTAAPTTVVAPDPSESEPVIVEDLTWTTPTVAPADVGTVVQATTGEAYPMTIAYPAAEPPVEGWPIVVHFHGAELGTSLYELDQHLGDRAVVVAPRWAPTAWSSQNLDALTAAEYADGYWFDVAACGLAAAQDAAVERGGDATRMTIVGFSGGVHPAARTALGEARNDLCPDREPAARPQAMIVGDSQFLFQGDNWDETFADSASLAPDTVDRMLNPSRWSPRPVGFVVYLWTTDATYWTRAIANPPAADSWITNRLPDGAALLEDLAAVGAFDDEKIMFGDNALLLQMRLESAGVPVLHEFFPTNHTYAPGVYERISEIVFDGEFS
ncbi:MAG: hypothetical protein HKN26_17220 [Acidimicrobiales bacterium]|nr:hypothetical protein [Acidimicrobiales bacterium]